MKTILAAVLLVTVASASTAAACDRFNRDYVSVNVGALPFFNVGFHVHSRPVPCPEVPFGPPRPQVVYVPAPQPQVVYVPQTQVYTPPPPPPPQVVYVPVAAPQPVYVRPRPVYVAPPPAYYAPPVVYRPAPGYYYGPRGEHGRRGWHRRHHHDRDWD